MLIFCLISSSFFFSGISGPEHLRTFVDHETLKKSSEEWIPIDLVKFDEKDLEKLCIEVLSPETMEQIKTLAHQGATGAGLYMKVYISFFCVLSEKVL